MQAIVQLADFQRNLALVLRAIPARPSHPILSSILFKANAETQQIKMVGFDLSLLIETAFSAEVKQGGELAIPAKLLHDIISRVSSGSIKLSSEGKTIEIKSEVGKYRIQANQAGEYPELPRIKSDIIYEVPSAAIVDGLKSTSFAASTDETKQVLTGIRFIVSPDTIKFAATDGHRLVEAVVAIENEVARQFAITVPGRVFAEIEKILSGHESLSLKFNDSMVVASAGKQSVTARVLEGLYPNYEALFVKEFEGSVIVDRQLLLAALDRISVLASQQNNLAKCLIDKGNQVINLSADCADIGSGVESIPCQISSEIPGLAFNCKYLTDGIKVMKSSQIEINLASEKAPITISPLGGQSMKYLVMPVQLRS